MFLENINRDSNSFWDWQTTVCFYVAVHLVNAHLAAKADLHYRSHTDVSNALDPFKPLNICAFPEDIYVAFMNLQWLSRRSRYLISERKVDASKEAHYTSNKFFARAIRNLDKLLKYIDTQYECSLPKVTVTCDRLKSETLNYFNTSF